MVYLVLFNSGLSVEDTISVRVKANSTEEALEIALIENIEYSGWNKYVKNA